jgi:copper(I)-binding protein
MKRRATSQLWITLAVVLALSSCVLMGPTVTPAITIEEPWSRQAAEGGNGAAFMTITNGTSRDDRLISAETSIARHVELHETVESDGVMRMIPQPDGFPLPAGATLELKPGGKHVMLMDLVNPLAPGQTYQLRLNFEAAGPITIEVPVREP